MNLPHITTYFHNAFQLKTNKQLISILGYYSYSVDQCINPLSKTIYADLEET